MQGLYGVQFRIEVQLITSFVYYARTLIQELHASLNWQGDKNKFEIADDMFWKDGKPFQIIGGDLHYFRVLPEVL